METACLVEKGQALAPEKIHSDATRTFTTVFPAMIWRIRMHRRLTGRRTPTLQVGIPALYTLGHEKTLSLHEGPLTLGRVAHVVYFR